MNKLFTNASLLVFEKEEPKILQDVSLEVKDSYITRITTDPLSEQYDEVIDCTNKLLIPGLINTHTHGAMMLLRGHGDDYPLDAWLKEKMWPKEALFTPEHIYWGSALSILEMIKSGTTCFADMYNHMDQVGNVVSEAGIRSVLSRGIIGFCSPEEQKEKLANAIGFAEQWQGASEGRITTMLSPHGWYTSPPSFLETIGEEAFTRNIPIHTHLCETRSEVMQCQEQYGKTPVEHLRDLGLLKNRMLAAHCVHVTDSDLHILKEHDVKLSHNPMSNLKLGSGIADVSEWMKHGIHPSLGTDSAASNNSLDLFEEMKMSALLQKGKLETPAVVPATEALRMATVYGAEAVFLQEEVGTLEIGKKADFISVDLRNPKLHPKTNLMANIVYTLNGNDVIDSYVDGNPIMINRECVTLDEEKILYHVNHLCTGLFQ